MILNFAHRGASGDYPENTMLAFEKAIEMGCDGIETDVHLSKDGVLVLIHDETVDRTTNKKGYVNDYTFEELSSMGVPSLDQLLVLAKNWNVLLNIELKVGLQWYEMIEEKVIEKLKRYHFVERTILSSFNHYSMVKCKMLCTEIKTGLLYMEALYKPEKYCAYVGADAIHPNYIVLTKQVVDEMHECGFKVHPYTVNSERAMRSMIEMGVDMIITNYPDRLKNILKE
ncbi:MAG: glycerophosphodiester phosphodiesterase [Clostridia bacterium]|jgi:glycerophosphoryl diester phosphodiesterase|nr:glycerophosphodiester phosphodiesterase [Clostridia bacterium]